MKEISTSNRWQKEKKRPTRVAEFFPNDFFFPKVISRHTHFGWLRPDRTTLATRGSFQVGPHLEIGHHLGFFLLLVADCPCGLLCIKRIRPIHHEFNYVSVSGAHRPKRRTLPIHFPRCSTIFVFFHFHQQPANQPKNIYKAKTYQ